MIHLPWKNKSRWIKILETEPHPVLRSTSLESKICGEEEGGIKAKVQVRSLRRPSQHSLHTDILRKQPNKVCNLTDSSINDLQASKHKRLRKPNDSYNFKGLPLNFKAYYQQRIFVYHFLF